MTTKTNIIATDVKVGQTIYRRGLGYTVTNTRNVFAGEPIVEFNVVRRGMIDQISVQATETVTVSA